MDLCDPLPDHDGSTYDRALDKVRLNAQQRRVYEAVRDGAWWTLAELEARTGDPQASVSARLRDFRKDKFGGFRVERRRRGVGTWEYRLLPPLPPLPAGQLDMKEKWLGWRRIR